MTLSQIEANVMNFQIKDGSLYTSEGIEVITINNYNNKITLSLLSGSDLEQYIVISDSSYNILRSKLKSFSSKNLELSAVEKKVIHLMKVAIDAGASDVHFVRNSESCEVKLRVNGYVYLHQAIPSSECDYLMFVLYNVMATTKDTTWNRKIPQDANILLTIKTKNYRFRYAHMPIFGEKSVNYHAVVRVIYPSQGNSICMTYEDFGYDRHDTEVIRAILNQSHGLFIVSGTTGSGKSTSLKKYIEALYHEKYKSKGVFITVEDPVEYLISGAQQSSVTTSGVESGNPFATAVKSAMRRDPDVLMIGEIRDGATADALSSAVESGHYCLSTIHAGSVMSVIQRLIGLGIRLDKIVSPGFLAGITSQKLVPKLCDRCKLPTIDEISKVKVFYASEKGCKYCSYSGFSGRLLLLESFLPSISDLKLISELDWVGLFESYRKKRYVGIGLGEGFIIKDKAYFNVLLGNLCINYLKLHFGDFHSEDKEIVYNVYKEIISTRTIPNDIGSSG